MQRCRDFFPLLIAFLFVAFASKGQVASSPFTEFGIGDLNTNGLAQSQGMGGIGISNGNNYYLNNVNPALLVFNHVTVFQGGMQIESKKLSDGTNTQSFKSGNMNYLAAAFPIKPNRWTTSVGLTPYSSVNYKISSQSFVSGTTTPENDQQIGKGGLTQFYWSNGVSVNKNFSLGIKAAYTFGAINTQYLTTSAVAVQNPSFFTRDAFNGFTITGGAAYHLDSLFKRNYRFSLGVVGTLPANLNAQHARTIEGISSGGIIIDSVSFPKQGGNLRIPGSVGAGISFGKVDRWTLGFDFTYLDYRSFSYKTNDGQEQYIGAPSTYPPRPTIGYRSGAGLEVTPNPEDFTNYFNRITYRLGASFEKSTMIMSLTNNPWTDVGGTFGVSLPVGRASSIDIGCKVGRRGTVSQNSLQENYFRVYFGITFNDQWFIKRKFD